MSHQPVDLCGSPQIARRRKRIAEVAFTVGIIPGAAFGGFSAPSPTSRRLVLPLRAAPSSGPGPP